MISERTMSSAILLLLTTLLVGVVAFPFCTKHDTTQEQTEHTTDNLGSQLQRPRATQEVLPEDMAILKAEFPGFVLPLERTRLTKRLMKAIEVSNETEVDRLLEKGAQVQWTGVNRSDTRSPLFRAIRRGNPRVVEALLKREAGVGNTAGLGILQRRNQWFQTPLYFAVRCGNREIVDLLLQYGASTSAHNGHSKRPIVGAIEDGNLEMYEFLLSKGAACDFEWLFGKDRVSSRDVRFDYPAEYFIPPFEDLSNQYYVGLLDVARQSGNAKLITAVNEQFTSSPSYSPKLRAEYAVRLGDADMLRKLIAEGYDPHSHSYNLLDWARKLNHAEIVDLLADARARHNAKFGSKKNTDPVDLAIESGSVEQLKELLEQGAKLKPKPSIRRDQVEEDSALKVAVLAKQEEMVVFLLQRPEAQGGWLEDSHLLLDALPFISKFALRDDPNDYPKSICEALIRAGVTVDFDSADKMPLNSNPFLRIARAGWIDAYRILSQRAPHLANHNTALQAAAHGNQAELCRCLIDQGADPNCDELNRLRTPLEYAMLHRNRELFDALVESGAKKIYPRQKNVSLGLHSFEDFGHPLYRAALVDDEPFCELLIQQFPPELVWQELKYEPNDEDDDIEYFKKGNTPLFAPVYGDHAETMKLLLAYGLQDDRNGNPLVDINAANKRGATALHEAINFGAAKCVQLLLASGADPARPTSKSLFNRRTRPLHIVTHDPDGFGHGARRQTSPTAPDIFPMLIAANMRQNDPNWPNQRDAKGITPLHSHARVVNTTNCLKLISLGADVNATAVDGRTPLFEATRGDYFYQSHLLPLRTRRSDLCIQLVQAGATHDSTGGSSSKSYYALAFEKGLFGFCDYLLEKGISPETDAHAGAYLCASIKFKRLDLLGNLIAEGADINAQDSEDNTALHWAVSARDVELCKRLLKLGADPNIADKDGCTSLFCLSDRCRYPIWRFGSWNQRGTEQEDDPLVLLKLLLDAGADPRATTHNKRSVSRVFDNMPQSLRKLIKTEISELNCSD